MQWQKSSQRQFMSSPGYMEMIPQFSKRGNTYQDEYVIIVEILYALMCFLFLLLLLV